MPNRGPGVYLFDAVELSNFALCGCLDLLMQRYGKRGWITTEVLDELAQGAARGHKELADVKAILGEQGLKEHTLTKAERDLYGTLLQTLGSGEASCIAAAKKRTAVVVTDDARARRVCANHRLRVTGTVGILVAVVRDGVLGVREADDILKRMVRAGFYSPVESVSWIVGKG